MIVVDSLAARSRRRILGTVQISDAGVVPGSGVGNHRTALNRQSLGLPVIAVGVPMVVRAAVIGRETLETALENIVQREGFNSVVGRRLTAYLREEGLDDLVCEDGPMHSFVVTPFPSTRPCATWPPWWRKGSTAVYSRSCASRRSKPCSHKWLDAREKPYRKGR